MTLAHNSCANAPRQTISIGLFLSLGAFFVGGLLVEVLEVFNREGRERGIINWQVGDGPGQAGRPLAVQPSEMRPFSMPTSVFLEMPSAKAVAVCVRPYSARTAFRWSPHNRMASARFKTRLASSLRPKQQWCNFTPLYMRGQIPHRADAVICYTTQRFGRASDEADGRSARLLS